MIYEKIKIWDPGEYNGLDKNFEPLLTVYSLDHKEKRPAVLIFPGGGYVMTSPREAEPIAMRFLQAGYNAFILDYSVKPNYHPQQLLDATRAMCLIHDNAKKWRVDDKQIAVCGFSAGGHLATSLCTHYMIPELQNIKGMAKDKNRPDLLISCYPVITSGEKAHKGSFENLSNNNQQVADSLSLENYVHDNMPPTFIWHTFADNCVPVENSLMLANALAEKKIPTELHIFPYGCHGLSTADWETNSADNCYPHVSKWMDLCLEWMQLYFKIVEFK